MMTSILKRIPVEKAIPLSFLLILIPVGIAAWVIEYPVTTGYVDYEVDRPVGYDLADARQALVNQGYSVETEIPEYGGDPYLLVTVNSEGGDSTILSLHVPDQGQTVEVHARRSTSLAPYEVAQSMDKLETGQQALAQEDVRDVAAAAGLPEGGTMTPIAYSDSLDYFIPTTVIYLLLFIHLPLTVLLVFLVVFMKGKEGPSYPPMDIYRH